MKKNLVKENKAILLANAFNTSIESAKRLVDADISMESAEKFLSMDKDDIIALCYKIISEEEKHFRENSHLYDPKRESIAEEMRDIYLFNGESEPQLKDSIDTLSFRKSFARIALGFTEDDEIYEEEYIIAEILINGQPLLGIIEQYDDYSHEYNYNTASLMYKELVGESTHHDCEHYLKGIDAVLLVCSTCYYDCCLQLIVRTKETEDEILWFQYYSCRSMNFDRSKFPVFRFEKEQYKMALAQLKEIAEM